MAMNMVFNYVVLDPSTGMCVQFMTRSAEADPLPENWMEVPVNDPEYLFKFYINDAWYEDAEATIPWESSLL